MKKIVPIITLLVALLIGCISTFGLTLIIVSVESTEIKLVAVPLLISGLTFSMMHAPISFFFKKDKLCLVSFIIDIIALALSLAALAVWLVAT